MVGTSTVVLRLRGNNIQLHSHTHIQDQVKKETIERRTKVITSLKFIQIDKRQRTIKGAHIKTCKWFLETSQYIDWLDTSKFDDHSGFLWIKGKPGAGKSTLMKFTISHAYQPLSDQGKIVISFFFNARGEELEKSTDGLYRSLIIQILELKPDLQRVLDAIDPSRPWNIELLRSLFEDLILAMDETSIICFIDALDECEERQIRDMLYFLHNISQKIASSGTHLHICFASRHYPHITVTKGLTLVIEGRQEHNQDITQYLKFELRIGQDILANQIRTEVQEKASGVFMWVVLVVSILNKEYDRGRKHTLKRRLEQIPSDLHNLFHDILTRDNDNEDGLRVCIQWILFAARPLRLEELYFAIMLGIEPEDLAMFHSENIVSVEDMENYIIDNSKGLAEVSGSSTTVQFIHESVRDFLLKENGLQKVWPELGSNLHGYGHEELKQCCFAYLRDIFLLDSDDPIPMWDLTTNPLNYFSGWFIATRIPRMWNRMNRIINMETGKPMLSHLYYGRCYDTATKFPFLGYSIENILYHADEANKCGLSQSEFISGFPFRAWIEYNNVIEGSKPMDEWPNVRWYASDVSLLYILASRNLARLIRTQDIRQSCFDIEQSEYGTPIFAALATQSFEAFWELLEQHTKTVPSSLSVKEVYTQKEEESLSPERLNSDFELIQLALESHNGFALRLLENYGPEKKKFIPGAKVGYKYFIQSLLWRGLKVEGTNRDRSLLQEAVAQEDMKLVQLFIKKGADIDGNKEYRSPLQDAVLKGHKEIIQLLFQSGANVEGNEGYTSPLQDAVIMGNARLVQMLLEKGANVEGRKSFLSPLLCAAIQGYEDIVRLLLHKGVNINVEGYPNSPLALAIERGYETMAQLLLSRGARDEPWAFVGKRLLIKAARKRQVRVVGALLASGVDIRGHDIPFRRLALLWENERDRAIIQLLIDYGVGYERNSPQ
ncbi:nacht and ankyrin domain-containing protein [Daldinia loculata]|uniref:nacht and ankyrin domain-containing protein n=1 Tax=Daldinia loculata TaxID=103429 RepID=UPI0020C44E17|nr:nacht and ankyrin domain-containing protein [Daldinia loculata]KAI1648973.1 nacht and ankyrin domain-containing protein [Daldinia loculata]